MIGSPPDEALETHRLLDDLFERSGMDFRDYTPAALRRRLRPLLEETDVYAMDSFRDKALSDPSLYERLLAALCARPSAFFRDPGFFRAFRAEVVPVLRTYPSPRLWVASCFTGEEIYSLAVVLHEEGILQRSRIYGTAPHESLIARARAATYPRSAIGARSYDYALSGGRRSLAHYFVADGEDARIHPGLRERVVLGQHSLLTDASFNEFQAVVCRDVLADFNRPLQLRAHRLFLGSLSLSGTLCLGAQDNPPLAEFGYQAVDARYGLYRRTH